MISIGGALAVGLLASTAAAQDPAADPAVDAGSAVALADAGTASAPAEEERPDAGAEISPHRFVVRNFESNKVAAEQAPGLTALLAGRMLEERLKVVTEQEIQQAVGLARQRQLLGACANEALCSSELAEALGARYVVSGRVDRFNERFLVSATIWDQERTEVTMKSQREVNDAGLLPQAVLEIVDELLAPFGVPPKVDVRLVDRVEPLGFNLGLKLGSTLITSVARLAPVGEIELALRVSHAWLVFIQVGFGIAFDQNTQTNVNLAPGLLGLRYHFRAEKSLQPTVGGGLGVISTINAAQGKARLSSALTLGLLYLITPHVSASAEASIDVLGLAYSVAERTSLLTGINLGISLAVNYRF